MCGIVGYYSSSQRISEQNLSSISSTLRHRGPDAGGTYRDGMCGLAHRRLSIIDLSDKANQPMHSHCKRYVMVYNGEVYNFEQIRQKLDKTYTICWRSHSDSEIILEAFVRWGTSFVEQLNGMYALAIYDSYTQQLFLCRDRMGIKPLFFYKDDNFFAFASELKSLMQFTCIEKKLAGKALFQYLHLGYIPQPDTIYEGVSKFPSGSYAVLNTDMSMKMTAYWQVEKEVSSALHIDFKEARKKLTSLIESAVAYRLKSDVPFGTFLSGGVDSSLVTAIAQKYCTKKIDTFSIGFESAVHDESAYAKQVARHLGTQHHTYILSEKQALEKIPHLLDLYDEPYADSSAIPTWLVSEMARKTVKMTLSGDGGDELFMGYGMYRWAQRMNIPGMTHLGKYVAMCLNRLPSSRYKRIAELLNYKKGSMMSHIFSQEQYFFSQEQIEQGLGISGCFEPQIDYTSLSRSLRAREKQALFDLTHYLKDDLLVKIDRATMAVGLETRVPLLDHRVVSFALNIDEQWKVQKGTMKYILKEVLYNYLPRSLFERPKWGFSIPLGAWLKKDLRFLIDENLSEKTISHFGVVNVEQVLELKKRFFSGQDYLYNRLWLLIVLHQFLRKNVD